MRDLAAKSPLDKLLEPAEFLQSIRLIGFLLHMRHDLGGQGNDHGPTPTPMFSSEQTEQTARIPSWKPHLFPQIVSTSILIIKHDIKLSLSPTVKTHHYDSPKRNVSPFPSPISSLHPSNTRSFDFPAPITRAEI